MPFRLARLGLGVLLSALLLGATSPAGHAETLVHRDPTGDVATLDWSSGFPVAVPAPHERTTDIHQVRVSHSRAAVRVIFRIHDMRHGNQLADLHLQVPGGHTEYLRLDREDGPTAFSTSLDAPGGLRPCRAAFGRLWPAQDKVVFSAPRRCLGNPGRIRAHLQYTTFDGALDGNPALVIDLGFRRGLLTDGEPVPWSPWVPAA